MTPRLPRLSYPSTRQGVAVGVVLVLWGAVTAGVAGLFLGDRQHPEVAARVAAATFVSRIADADAVAAYDLLCAATRTRLDRAELTNWTRRLQIADHWVGAARPGPDPTSAVVGVRLTGPSGTARVVEFTVVAERGTWRVCAGPW